MIVGKNSAFKGFMLFIAVVVALLSMIVCVTNGETTAMVVSFVNLALVATGCIYLFNKWSKE